MYVTLSRPHSRLGAFLYHRELLVVGVHDQGKGAAGDAAEDCQPRIFHLRVRDHTKVGGDEAKEALDEGHLVVQVPRITVLAELTYRARCLGVDVVIGKAWAGAAKQ